MEGGRGATNDGVKEMNEVVVVVVVAVVGAIAGEATPGLFYHILFSFGYPTRLHIPQ